MLMVSLDTRLMLKEKTYNVSVICFVKMYYLAPEFPILEKQNWLIHLHYIRKDYEACKVRGCSDREHERQALVRHLTVSVPLFVAVYISLIMYEFMFPYILCIS